MWQPRGGDGGADLCDFVCRMWRMGQFGLACLSQNRFIFSLELINLALQVVNDEVQIFQTILNRNKRTLVVKTIDTHRLQVVAQQLVGC